MPPSLPSRFDSVETAKSSQGFHNVIGVVVDCRPKSKTGGSSYLVTFTIKDSDYGKGNQSWTGLKVKYFSDNEHRLPDLRVDDVILLRQLKVRLYQGTLIGVISARDNVSWAVFRQAEGLGSLDIPMSSPGSSEATLGEKTYANWLLDSVARSRSRSRSKNSSTPMSMTRRADYSITPSNPKEQQIAPASAPAAAPKKKDKFSLIKNVSSGTFVDLTVHVVKTWYDGDRIQLYVTDYTVNKSLWDYGDKPDEGENEGAFVNDFGYMTRETREQRHWQGPMGRMTLQITLFEPHSIYARENVNEDSYVVLKNVHVKIDKMHGKTEGLMHGDRMYPDKVGIWLIDDDNEDTRFVELKTRKLEYWRQNKMNKRKPAEELGEDSGGLKKNAKKRRKEQQRLKKQQEQQQKQQAQRIEEGQMEIPATMIRANVPNPHIQAKDPSRTCRNLSEILQNESHNISLPDGIQYRLPFQNVKYRTTVRVVDFFPPDIADFAVARPPPQFPSSSSPPPSGSEDEDDYVSLNPYGIKWEWRFCLLVEDAKIAPGQNRDRIKLYVSGAEAEFLLNLDATDLRRNRDTFIKLQEKLCILWGDLEERKRAGMMDAQQKASQLPFHCCIKEYGVRCACQRKSGRRNADGSNNSFVLGPEHNLDCLGWERRFALFGTTIHEE